MDQKGAKFLYYTPAVIKQIKFNNYGFSEVSNSFLGSFFKVVISWPIPNPSFWRNSKIRSKEGQICISSTICEKGDKP